MANGRIHTPTQQQAAAWFLIPLSTINRWWAQKDEILKSQKGSRFNVQRVWTCCWPEMERRLFELFCERRNGGYIVRRYWFQKMSQKLFRQIHVEPLRAKGKIREAADMDSLFVCSSGWFEGFCRRNSISLRRLTRIVRICILNREPELIY